MGLSIEFSEKVTTEIEHIAHSTGVSPREVVMEWVADGLQKELLRHFLVAINVPADVVR